MFSCYSIFNVSRLYFFSIFCGVGKRFVSDDGDADDEDGDDGSSADNGNDDYHNDD